METGWVQDWVNIRRQLHIAFGLCRQAPVRHVTSCPASDACQQQLQVFPVQPQAYAASHSAVCSTFPPHLPDTEEWQGMPLGDRALQTAKHLEQGVQELQDITCAPGAGLQAPHVRVI